MGWADLLIKLGIPYASEEARTLARHVMGAVDRWAVEASEELAGERGPFHHWPDSSWARDGQKPRRHSTATVIAPTGTISMIAGCSSGIEPEFALSMTRDQAGMIMHEVHPLVEEVARREGFWSDELAETVKATGSLATAPGVPDHWRAVFAIANELDMEAHIGMQSAFQQYTQDAVSKTINLKNDASMADVERAYMLAWTNNCKGITVYRDGCRDHQVLTAGVKTDATATIRVETEAVKTVDGTPAPSAPVPHVYPRRRIPADGRRKGETLSRSTSFGTAHVTINEHPDDQQPFELFARLGKSGAEVMAWAEAFGRTVSYALSMESPVAPSLRLEAIANQLVGIGGSNYGFGETRVDSAPDAIGKTMLTYLGKNVPEENAQPVYNKTAATSPKDLCPECGQATLVIGGTGQRCGLCTSCGYSNCG
jgi:ribonucleoside-diphosphate reductase alpha chain